MNENPEAIYVRSCPTCGQHTTATGNCASCRTRAERDAAVAGQRRLREALKRIYPLAANAFTPALACEQIAAIAQEALDA